MNRVVMWSVLIGLATTYLPASAMEFGQVRVQSGPGQPLRAEVQLRPQRAGELDHIQVSLATAAEFSHAGLDAQRSGLPLQFGLRDAGHGRQWLQISSQAAVDAAYLDILLAIQGPQGRSLHELPLVLDPDGRQLMAPAHSQAAATAATAPLAAQATPVPSASPQIRVQPGQTLSAIALQHRLSGVSLDQMLLAFQQANPQAFYANNISALKAGAILRTPNRSEAEAISRNEAFHAVTQQNQSWRAGRPARPSVLANAAAAPVAAPRPSPAATGDRLSLRAGKGQPRATQGGSLAQEALRTSQQQAAELGSRIHDLQVMQQERERLIALKSQQIAQLQQQLQAAGAHVPTRVAFHPAVSTLAAPGPSRADGTRPAAVTGGHTGAIWAGLAAVTVLGAAVVARRRRRKDSPPLSGPDATAPFEPASPPPPGPVEVEPVAAAAAGPLDVERELIRLNGLLQQDPGNISLYFELASLYYARHDVAHFVATAEAMHAQLDRPHDPDWDEVRQMGCELLPAHPLFAAEPASTVAPAMAAAAYASVQQAAVTAPETDDKPPLQAGPAPQPMPELEPEPEPEPTPAPVVEPVVESKPVVEPGLVPESAALASAAAAPAGAVEPAPAPPPVAEAASPSPPSPPSPPPSSPAGYGAPDAIDTKLDLARAYLDMHVPASARVMLEEVLAEGSQMQKDVARQLLDGMAPG